MPIETRWFRNERWVDTFWMLALSKIQTVQVVSYSIAVGVLTCTVGIKVYVDTELISGVDPVATVMYANDDYQVVRSASWLCPETNISGKYVKVEIWVFVGTGWEDLLITFRTEVFTGRKLDPYEWTVYYTGSYTAILFPIPKSSFDFHFDGNFLSRIEGFSHSPLPVPPKPYGNAFFWVT